MADRPKRSLPTKLLVAVFAAGLSSALLVACGGSAGSGPGPGGPTVFIETTVEVRVLSGTALRGVSFELAHPSTFSLVDIVPDGPFVTGSCAHDEALTLLTAACVAAAPFDSPVQGWLLTLRHPVGGAPRRDASILCEGSGESGTVVPLSCDLD